VLDGVIYALDREGSHYKNEIKEILRKVECQIEPAAEEWELVDHIMDNMEFE
jgi:hypothetical protein